MKPTSLWVTRAIDRLNREVNFRAFSESIYVDDVLRWDVEKAVDPVSNWSSEEGIHDARMEVHENVIYIEEEA